MEKLSVSKERVIEVANKCSTAKNILMVLFPEVFEVVQDFKEGQWIVMTNDYGDSIKKGNVLRLIGRQTVNSRCWVVEHSDVRNYLAPYEDYMRPATKEEIEKHLSILADKKGLVKGVKIKMIDGRNAGDTSHYKLAGKFTYYPENDVLMSDSNVCDYTIYKKGVWAEIIQEPVIVEITMDEIAKLKGCDVSQLKIKK